MAALLVSGLTNLMKGRIWLNGAGTNLMAALMGMQIDNALIEIDGEEVPILDGSAQLFIDHLSKAGTQKQGTEKIYYNIQQALSKS